MRRHLLRSIIVLVTTCLAVLLMAGSAAGLATGSGGWQWQNPLPQGNDYSAGYFLNATHGWLVGGGDIFHTTNGGLTLTVQARHGVTFKAITFVGARHGWAVGYPTAKGKAVIYRTVNGGATWLRAPLARVGGVDQVSFATTATGWATCGNAALHTTDGGRHWTVHVMARHDRLIAVQTLSARVAWVTAGSDTLLRTTNGGATWKRLHTGVATHLGLIHFASPARGWVAGQGKIVHTTDGGAHWTVQLAIQATITALSFADSRDGWATAGGALYRTTDGGAHWVQQTTAPVAAWAFALKAPGSVVLAGPVYGGSGGVASTSDAGVTWRQTTRTPAGSADLAALQFSDATTGWAAGSGGEIIRTSDGGSTWTAQASGTTADLHGVRFVDATNGWAVGGQGVIVNSTDGGADWTAQTSGVTDDLLGVSFANATNGWVVGHSAYSYFLPTTAVILATTDGGAHWATQTAPLPAADAELTDVVFADATHGWAVGAILGDEGTNASVILATTNGGATWTRQLTYHPPVLENQPGAVLTAIACSDARHLVAVGTDDSGCEVFRTANGGATWTGLSRAAKASLGFFDLSDVVLASATRGWAVGDGTIAETTNGGATWTRQSVGVGVGLDALSFVSLTHGWVAGQNASILTTTTAGNAP